MSSHAQMREIEELRARLAVAEETLQAIITGEVDALVVERSTGPEVYTLKSASEPYRVLVEQMAQGALTVTTDGLILYCNESFARMVDCRRERLIGTRLCEYAIGDGVGAVINLLSEQVTTGREITLSTKTGTTLETLVSAVPLVMDGEELRCLAVTDLSDQELRRQYAAVVQAAEAAIYMLDPDFKIKTWNRGAELQAGLPAAQAIGRDERDLWPDESREELERLIRHCCKEGTAMTVELQRRRGCEDFGTLLYTLTPLRNREGAVTGYSVVAHDITERKRAEEQRQLLVNELNHRVKNTLAIVQGIAFQSFKKAGVDGHQATAVFESRLAALASTHNLLTRSNWASMRLDELAGEILKRGHTDGSQIQIAGPLIVLRPKQAVTLAMAFHELLTNAIKYGALSVKAGHVDLDWALCRDNGQKRLELIWRERNGPTVKPPSQRGFGSRMIEQALAYELDGAVKMDFRAEGLVCTIEAVLP